MTRWLALGAAVSSAWAGEAAAQTKAFEAARIAGIVPRPPELHPAPNLRISGTGSVAPSHIDVGMLVSRDVAPNAVLGLGLMNLAGRKKSGATAGMSGGSRRKPAVTFVLHF
jgi:hypothetical protein